MNHSIHFFGPVTFRSANMLLGIFQTILRNYQGRDDQITLYLSSEGGDLNSGFSLYNFIRSYPLPIKIINMGTIESIAVMIYLAADERYSIENSRFLFHSFHWGYSNHPVDFQRLAENSSSLSFDTTRYISIFKERTSTAKTPIDIEQCLTGSSKIISCTDAVSSAVCSKVIAPKDLCTTADNYYWVDSF